MVRCNRGAEFGLIVPRVKAYFRLPQATASWVSLATSSASASA